VQKDGAKRLVMAHEQAARQDRPRCFLTEAKHGESPRMLETWSSRWTAAVLHACEKPGCGREAAQGRKEEAVTRPCRLRCGAQALLQRAPALASQSERDAFAEGHSTCGQQCRAISREVLCARLAFCQRSFAEGKTCDHILARLMPV
jgi:hypothetical protein